jgi:lycopene beta-cyclase
MGSDEHADVVILGGGCAGLSLAAQLAQPGGAALRTVILEPRGHYSNDRTWSAWRGKPHLFSSCASASWAGWRVAAGGRAVIRGHAQRCYETIPASAFHAEAQRRIAAAPQISLRLGVFALRTGADNDGAWVDTPQRRLRARIVVDTRPPKPVAGAGLLQTFTGLEIETERPCFDPAVADLMLFDAPSRQHISFMYGLPLSATRALLELTRFSAHAMAPPSEAEVLARLAGTQMAAGGKYKICRFETGTLAMRPGLPPPLQHRRLLRLGTLAGAARPATGYAFVSIQQQAEALAAKLRQGTDAALGWQPAPLPAWMRFMDRLFLRVLRHHPARGPELLLSLFEHCPPSALIRFLSGDASLADAAAVAIALPPAPFLAALLSAAPSQLPGTLAPQVAA